MTTEVCMLLYYCTVFHCYHYHSPVCVNIDVFERQIEMYSHAHYCMVYAWHAFLASSWPPTPLPPLSTGMAAPVVVPVFDGLCCPCMVISNFGPVTMHYTVLVVSFLSGREEHESLHGSGKPSFREGVRVILEASWVRSPSSFMCHFTLAIYTTSSSLRWMCRSLCWLYP